MLKLKHTILQISEDLLDAGIEQCAL